MELHERQHVAQQLIASEERLFVLVDGLTPAQWHFRENPDRWSIAENIEHLLLFEAFLRQAITRVLEAPAQPEKKSPSSAKDLLVRGLADSRDTKLTTREVNRPTGRFPDPAELLDELKASRAHTLHFVRETQAPLRDHFFPHIAFGDLDCFQWLELLSQHTLRHALQIEQIKADASYPASPQS